MSLKYDPILCMMVEQPAMKARDAEPLKEGQKYKNRNGVVVEIITVEPNYVFVDFGGTKKDFTPYGLQKILSDNGYKKVRDAKARDVDKYAETRNSVLKYKADTDKAAFKKYHAISKGR